MGDDEAVMQQVAANAWLGTGTSVNWLVVREGADVTLVDSGYPGDGARLAASLAEVGLSPAAVTAVLLTHAHVDHVGGLNELHARHQTPVYMNPAEVPLARGEQQEQATPLDVIRRSWRPRVAAWGVQIIRAGALNHPVVAHAAPWIGDVTGWASGAQSLDLPGRPVPVPSPGHTSGHAAYLFPSIGVIATGDGLVTGHPTTGKSAPHLLPECFSTSPDLARRALDRLASVSADVVVPGHGPVWNGPVRTAAEIAARDYDEQWVQVS